MFFLLCCWFPVNITKLAGAVEYTDCIFAEGKSPMCVLEDTKQSDGVVPVMENAEYPFIDITPWSTLAQIGSTL